MVGVTGLDADDKTTFAASDERSLLVFVSSM